MDTERIVMELIVNSGNARSKAFEAIDAAESGDFEKASQLIKEGGSDLNKAHITQTTLIQNEINGEKVEINLLLIHAQDHLMTSITVRELAEKMIKMYKNNIGR